MTFWTPDTLRSVCSGSWLARPKRPESHPHLSGLSTDSRALVPGQVFLALRGERHDAHQYLPQALRHGSPLLIVDNPDAAPAGADAYILRVADTARALLRLAAAYRKSLESTRVIAVTGSNGKTTTTRLIHAALSSSLRGSASARSFNNAVGVPLTILGAQPTDQFLICEVGTNAPGEIAQLAGIVEPDVAVITSIGREHLEKLGSIEGVAREEASILSYLRPGGLAVVTADCPLLTDQLKPVPNVVTFGRAEHADLRLTSVEHVPADTMGAAPMLRFTINGRITARIPLIGEHNALNALAAFAVARRLGIDEPRILQALANAPAADMRLQPLSIGVPGLPPITLLNDAYNANPDSMTAALSTLADLGADAPRRVAVLGDMLELGAASERSHLEIADHILSLPPPAIDLVVCVGHAMLHAADRLIQAGGWDHDRVVLVSDLDAGQAAPVAALLRSGDTVLLKGSRRMRLERIVQALRDRWSPNPDARPPLTPAPAARP